MWSGSGGSWKSRSEAVTAEHERDQELGESPGLGQDYSLVHWVYHCCRSVLLFVCLENGMIQRLQKALEGKKTNLISAWAFCGALYMWMNGLGEAEVSATLATVAALAASMRAGIARNGGAVALVAIVAGIFLVGCASLGTIDPATGTSPAQDIVAGTAEALAPFGVGVGTAVPLSLAGILSIIIALGKVKGNSGAPE